MGLFEDMLRGVSSPEEMDLTTVVFYAIMSDDLDDLEEVVDRVREEGSFSDDFAYGLEGLHAYRQFYEEHMSSFSPEQQELIERYDDEWSAELVRQLQDYERDKFSEETPDLKMA